MMRPEQSTLLQLTRKKMFLCGLSPDTTGEQSKQVFQLMHLPDQHAGVVWGLGEKKPPATRLYESK